MITSAKQSDWPGDTTISDREIAGLQQPCKVRIKLFTLEQRLIEKRIGALGLADRQAVTAALQHVIGS